MDQHQSSNKTFQFRKEYRESIIPKWYSGVFHFCFFMIILGGVATAAILRVRDLKLLEALVVPCMFVLGNAVEYWMHRIPLHRSLFGFRKIYRIHSLQHHRFFTYVDNAYENFRDFHMVFFPMWAPVLNIIFLGLFGKFILLPSLGDNITFLFIASGSLYFILYEFFHYSHHVPDSSWYKPWIRRIKPLNYSGEAHRIHHHPKWMSKKNFNVTFPLFDFIMGTYQKHI